MTESTLTWPMLRDRIERVDRSSVFRLLIAATEEQRLALARDLEAYVRQVPADRWWGDKGNPAAGVGLAAIGCLPSAARAAALLCRRSVRDVWGRIPTRLFLDLARARQVPWLGDLAVRLADRLDRDAFHWNFVAALLIETGATPPANEGFLRGWLNGVLTVDPHRRAVPLADRLRDDPFLDLVLPSIFEVDGIGNHLVQGRWDNQRGVWDDTPIFPTTLALLAGEGRLDRKVLLDGCLGRFLRGDRPGALRPFLLLHETLTPTVDELADRVLDYARLLPDASSTVAGLAQRALRVIDDAGRLELATLLDVSRQTLLRREKGLVKAQLGWLDRVARRHPDRAGEVLDVVSVAFGHEALDVQDRALTVVARHLTRVDAAAVAGLAVSADLLGGDLPTRAAELFGTAGASSGETPADSTSAGLFGLPVPTPAEMPTPIGSAAELAEEIAALVHGGETAVAWERILAGLVALHAVDRAGLADALMAVLDRHEDVFDNQTWVHQHRLVWLGEAIRSAITPGRHSGVWNRMVSSRRTSSAAGGVRRVTVIRGARDDDSFGLPDSGIPRSFDQVLGLRIAEVAVQLDRRPVPLLVSTPTSVTGSLAVEVLLGRIEAAEAAGWQPWSRDLEQALLRLPRETDPTLGTRVRALSSPSGKRLAGWLAAGGASDPVAVRVEQRPEPNRSRNYWQPAATLVRRVVVNLQPAGEPLGRLDEQLFTLHRRTTPTIASVTASDLWPATLPHHREVVAAWALPGIAALADSDGRGDGALLPLLAECDGPVGSAMVLALAYTLAARHEADRVAGVDAFLLLSGTGTEFAAGVGRELGDLGADGTIKLSRVVPALADAARAGAGATVWQVIVAALPGLLPAAPRGLPDLLALGAQVATHRGAGDPVPCPELTAVAARGGTSRLATEARRLQRVLAG
ncbi:hypothetical protein GCM10027280_23170 [Micromonospora polyrhachis]|uniref:Uncharacterized protein n=1 Tax=Micromonospora polyrhachis TaxID=1282883 RepID=A0A7W7SX80_9ACTN|nr:DUF6493 family protein [Micromonospora polyrhachis]MBB4962549.1 hypothetical protein [Micromonospora polyrhachis]